MGGYAGRPDAECACGHLRASHRARGCVAVVPCPDRDRSGEGGVGCLVRHFCACREFRPKP